ncbi:MAG TPA: PHP domain-containing protein, partial [Chryseolinea sp.]
MYLNCHTGFSFKYGTIPIEGLFNEAKRCGVSKLVLTEIHNTASYMEMLRVCAKNREFKNGVTKFGKEPYHLDIAVGIEFRNADELLYIGIAKNNLGFESLNRFLSYKNREDRSLPARAPVLDDVFFVYPFGKVDPEALRPFEFIGVRKNELNAFAIHPSRVECSGKFVILHPVTFLPPEKKNGKLVYRDHNVHRLLRCIANNTLLSKLAEHQQAGKDEFMLPVEDIKQWFSGCPELIVNTENLLQQCSIVCNQHEDKNKKFFTGSKQGDLQYLRAETKKGFARRYGDNKSIWSERIEKELAIIENKNFTAYYLITYDLIHYARSQGFDFVGRGSGANSTVAYCLGIT